MAGTIWNLIVGVVGAVIAGFMLPLLGFYTGVGLIAAIVNAHRAVVFLVIVLQSEKT